MSNNMRDEIIQVLLATSCQSEGMTADAILQAVTHHQAESEPVAEVMHCYDHEGRDSVRVEVIDYGINPGDLLCRCPQPAAQVPDGWRGWCDVAEHGYPKDAQQVLFVLDGKTVAGAFIGGIFWYNNKKHAAALWRPFPEPLRPDEHRNLLSVALGAPRQDRDCCNQNPCAHPGVGPCDKPAPAAPSIAENREPEQYEIGIYGKAYDGPGKHRAYTHREQPDNFAAGRLGEAARAARPGGDLIDYGLSLLRQLQEQGFGVFEIGRPEPPEVE